MTPFILRRKALGLGSCKGIKEASQTGIDFVRNDKLNTINWDNVSMVFRWGCTSNLPTDKVVNTAKAIHTVSDKSAFRSSCMGDAEANVFTPETVFNAYDAANLLQSCESLFIRPKHHAQGKHIYLASNETEVLKAINKCGDGWYASAFVKKKAEYRVFVAQGRVVWVANKIPDDVNDVAWNVAKGGKFENVKWGDWNPFVMKAAIAAFNVSGLDFGGVDIMIDEDNHAWVIEINSAPSQTSPYRQSCTAKAFDWIVEQGKEHLSLNEKYEGWRTFIHPGVWNK